jgi:hypothetical protein
MAMKQTLIFLVAILTVTISCKKKEPAMDQGYGRVLLANSNTPVPNALVRFVSFGDSPWSTALNEEASIITDELGRFKLPAPDGANTVVAFGPEDLFPWESAFTDVETEHYTGEQILYLYLYPPGYVSITTLDEEPLNPEVSEFSIATSDVVNPDFVTPNNQPIVYRTRAHTYHDVRYRIYPDGFESTDPQPPIQRLRVDWVNAYDTTHVVITY